MAADYVIVGSGINALVAAALLGRKGRKVLLIDEVDDSRTTLAYCLGELLSHQPAEIGVAVLHCKDKPKHAQFPSEVRRYWVGQHLDDIWVVYPWDAEDIDGHEAHTRPAPLA